MIVGDPRAAASAPSEPHDERTFPRPVGEGALIFNQPREYRMGAYSWSVRLDRPGRPGVDLPRSLSLAPLAPWSPDGARIAYHATDQSEDRAGVLLGDIDAGYRWLTGVPRSPHAILWSARRGLLLVNGRSWFRVFDDRGNALS